MRVGWSGAGALAMTLGVAGCATQADLLQQERKMTGLIEQQSRSIDSLRNEIEALRDERNPRGTAAPGRPPVARTPFRAKEKSKVTDTPLPSSPPPMAPNQPIGETPAPESREDARPSAAPSEAMAAVPPAAAATPPPAAEPAPAGSAAPGEPGSADADWRREVAQDRAVASATGGPERAQYVKSLEGLEKGDCAKAIPGLKAVSASSKGSPLTDNAMYWQARCLAARGDDRKAVAGAKEGPGRDATRDTARGAARG